MIQGISQNPCKAYPQMPLNDRQIKAAKPADTGKKIKLFDGNSLYLEVTPAGGKIFRMRYRIDGKDKDFTIGKYPAVSLVEARQAAENARRMIAQGQDPTKAKQEAKAARQAALLNTFEHLAKQWHKDNLPRWKEHHAERIMRYLKNDVFPVIGEIPVDEIKVTHIKNLLDDIMARGVTDTADKIRGWIGAVFDYSAMLEISENNPARLLKNHIPNLPTKHKPALPREELPEFYRRLILANNIERQNKIAIMLIMLVFVRNNELRGGQWQEVDFKNKRWIIPAERMKHEKMKPKPALCVPLSDWAIELLQELHTLTGHSRFMFPSRTNVNRHISENTLGKIINEKLGYKGRATPHGFRAVASSLLYENNFNGGAIETQLAHVEENKIKDSYAYQADYMPQRIEFMQWYSDYLRERYNQALQMIQKDKTG